MQSPCHQSSHDDKDELDRNGISIFFADQGFDFELVDQEDDEANGGNGDSDVVYLTHLLEDCDVALLEKQRNVVGGHKNNSWQFFCTFLTTPLMTFFKDLYSFKQFNEVKNRSKPTRNLIFLITLYF